MGGIRVWGPVLGIFHFIQGPGRWFMPGPDTHPMQRDMWGVFGKRVYS